MRVRFVGSVLVILLFGLVAPALAQTSVTGSLEGTIKDQKGESLQGVTVIASSPVLIAREARTVTDDRGVFRFPSLPPGAYVLEAQLAGLQTVRQENVRVRLGQSLAVTLSMAVGQIKEEIRVSAAAPVVSVVSNAVASNLDEEFLGTQPLPRNFYNIIKAAPGVNVDYTGSSGSAMLAFGGTTESQNAFTMDGVNVADAAAGQHWVLPAVQWMQEIQVAGLGAPAEYGGYTGAIINGVTKSGGNEFHGEVEAYYQPEAWTSNNDPEGGTQETFKFSDYAISLGGPVVKEKAWFFVSGEIWNQVTTPVGALDTSDRTIPRYLGKITWQASPQNRLMFMVEHDAVTNERRGIDAYTLPEATSKQDGPGTSYAVHWEALINPNNFINVKFTGYDGRDDYLPYHGMDTPGRVDEDSGYEWVNQDIHELNDRSIREVEASWSLFRNGVWGKDDSNSIKIGMSYERGESSDVWRRNGGFTYYDFSGDCESLEAYFTDPTCGPYYIERGYGEYDAHPKYSGWAVYVQDSVRYGRWTFNPGIRYGGYTGGWQSGYGDPNVYDVNYLDPRFGFVWDVRGDERTAFKAHWGRYHEKMYTYLFDREASGHATIPDQDCYWDPGTQDYTDCEAPTVIEAQMGQVDHPYVDETVLTFEQQFTGEMMVGVDLVDRKFRKIMTMINTNDDYELITATDNPLTGGDLPIYNLLSPPVFVLTTQNDAYRDFRSATLRFEKRHSNGWSLNSSVVWSDLDGNVLANNGYGPEFQDRNGMTNADGRMDYAFSEWEFKVSGAVDLPLGFQASGLYTYYSGWYWTPYVRISGLDYNTSTGRNINLVPRGDEKFPARHLLDLRLAWSWRIQKDMKLTAQLEGFQVFNNSTVLDVYNRWGTYYIGDEDPWYPRSSYGSPYQIENPRMIRAGVRFEF